MSDLLGLLCSVHIRQSSLATPPFSHKVQANLNSLNKGKIDSIMSSKDEFDLFVDACFTVFVEENQSIPIGSVHTNPPVWTLFALKAITTASNDEVVFPNGCCNNSSCPINKYYEIVLKSLI